jgi:uncharacterized protein
VNARTYPRSFSVILALVVLGTIFQSAEAQQGQVTFPEKPQPGNYVIDEAGLISQADRRTINEVAAALWQDNAAPIIAVTITSLADHNAAGYTIEQYAFELFNHWGIGNERHNYGMLLLVSEGDRKARIELGAAWGQNHNDQAQEVMDTLIIPRFREGKFSEGIRLGVRGMDTLARGVAPRMRWLTLGEAIFIIAFIVLTVAVIISLFKHGRKGWGWAVISLLGMALIVLFKVLMFLAIFGGGDSGGGGASGDW